MEYHRQYKWLSRPLAGKISVRLSPAGEPGSSCFVLGRPKIAEVCSYYHTDFKIGRLGVTHVSGLYRQNDKGE
jgi:hypothetical protein